MVASDRAVPLLAVVRGVAQQLDLAPGVGAGTCSKENTMSVPAPVGPLGPRIPRRAALLTPPALLGLAACGPNASGGSDDSGDGTTLRFYWWGNTTRDAQTNEAADLYLEEHPELTISREPTDWGGYWDKLATQVAGGDTPDVMQMDEGYLAEYSSRGVLLDMGGTAFDPAQFDPSALDAGKVEGTLYAVNAGVNAPVLLANPAVFEEAGVEMPDDTTWTWDDLVEIAARITESTPEGTYGVQQLGIQGDPNQSVFLRQLGGEKFDGSSLGFTAEQLTQWFDLAVRLQEAGACPGADAAVEESGQTVDQSMFAVGTVALQSQWSNQLVSFDNLLDGTVRMLRLPSMTGSAADAKLWYKASMYFAVAADSALQEEAVEFVDWLTNSLDAGRILLAERGVPANLEVREAIAGELGESDLKVFDYIDAIAEELGDPPPITPPGGGAVGDAMQRAMEEVLFGRVSVADGVAAAIAESESALS